jgi:hypothetical protein
MEWKPMDPAALKVRPARTIGVVATKPSAFYAQTMIKSQLGLIGVAAMQSEGQRIIREHSVADPSLRIATRLWAAVAAKHSLVQQTPKNLAAANADARWDTDLILTVATTDWSMGPFPNDWSRYWVNYEADVVLRDARDQRVLASGSCQRSSPENSEHSPTYDQMEALDATILRRRLDAAAAFCASKFARELFDSRLPEDRTPEPIPGVTPQVAYASCNLEGTAAWEKADASEKLRLLHECQEKRRTRPVPAIVATPSAPVAPGPESPATDPRPPLPPPEVPAPQVPAN